MSAENKQWFELWFDSPFYHILYKNRNQDEANQFIDNIIEHLKIKNVSILDMACGKGRHAYHLAEKGFTVNTKLGFGNPKHAIPEIVNQDKSDLLVMGAHGHTGVKDILFGTTVDAVRHRIKIPVFIVRK